ncbi:MAG: SAM-dependent methyltransferase, partial [Actinomycetota bacterium]
APRRVAEWRRRLQESHAAGRTTVLWGGGSKAVAFLTTLGVGDEIAAAVDINPRKHGTYLGGTGHQVIGPDDLVDLQPDEVIVMNPIYTDEIAADLRSRSLEPVITPLD